VKSYHVEYGGGLSSLSVREHPQPEPRSREVLVRIRANSLSFRELSILRGRYPLPVKPDVVPVSDGAGEVVAVGPGVTRVKAGDRVAAAIFPRWIDGPFGPEQAAQLGGSLDGLLTEYAVLPEEALVHLPAHLSFEEGATLPCAAVTAWNALTGGRGLRAGETVLTLGSGGVSLFALQLAKLFGARVIATTGSKAKAERLRALGADEVLDYRSTPAWEGRVRELTGGRGVDHVVEVVGTLTQSLKSVTIEGEVAFVGLLSDEARATPIDPYLLFTSVAVLRVVAVGSRAQFNAMNRAISQHRLRPLIDRVFPFAEAPEAYRYYQAARPFGKVVITHL
jgi:NADPH:quinone reductase-like Zn-dependent oxidoreductase